jgi:hypothetical protein
MVDVSMLGARIAGPHGMPLGAEVTLRLIGAEPSLPDQLGHATITRSDGAGDVGVRFVRGDSVARVASQKLYAAVQQAWSKTAETEHSPLCCKGGTVLEPPLPHVKTHT